MTALCFGVEQYTLYSSSRSLQLRCWDLRSGQCIHSWKVGTAPELVLEGVTGTNFRSVDVAGSCSAHNSYGCGRLGGTACQWCC